MPVYKHYCGGELENISYIIKANNCCGDEESTDQPSDCCHNEDSFIKNDSHFSIQILNFDFSKSFVQNFSFITTIQHSTFNIEHLLFKPYTQYPPPKLQSQNIIATSVLII